MGSGGGFEELADLENHFIQFAEITFVEIKDQAVQIDKFVVLDFDLHRLVGGGTSMRMKRFNCS